MLRRRIRELDGDIARQLEEQELGALLTSIDGIGNNTAARLIAQLGDLGRFRNAAALAAYVGHARLPADRPASATNLRKVTWLGLPSAVGSGPWRVSRGPDLVADRRQRPSRALTDGGSDTATA